VIESAIDEVVLNAAAELGKAYGLSIRQSVSNVG
jgi:hypothetical protein